MRNSERPGYWRGVIAEQRASGLSIADWCSRHNVSYHSFRTWRSRLNRVPAQEPEGRWLSLNVQPAPARNPLVVRVGVASIEVDDGFDAQLLVSVVAALSSPC